MKILLGLVLMCAVVSVSEARTDADDTTKYDGLRAPSRFYVGLTGGYGKTFPTSKIVNPFLKGKDFDNVQSNTLFIGASGEYFLRRINRDDPFSSLAFKIIYRNYSTSNALFSQTEEKTSGSQTQLVETQYSTTYNSSSISFETLYSLHLYSSPLSIIAGPGFGFLLNENLSKRAEIVSPSDFTFDENSFEGAYSLEQNGRAAVFKSGNASMLQVYVKAGIQYNLFFGQRNQFQLIPSVSYNFGITKLYSEEKFRLNTIDFGLDFRTAF